MIYVGYELVTIVDLLSAHESQMFHWLPFNRGVLAEVPADHTARRAWLRNWHGERLREQANRFRKELIAAYGSERGAKVEFAEAFEISEYASKLDAAAKGRLFPLSSSGASNPGRAKVHFPDTQELLVVLANGGFEFP